MSNFIRDVGEDLARGRVYLPQEDLDRFGVTREDLAAGVVTDDIRKLLAFEIARTRELYAAGLARACSSSSRPADPACAPPIELYGGILAEVERADYQVLDRRVRVPGCGSGPGSRHGVRSVRVNARWQRA